MLIALTVANVISIVLFVLLWRCVTRLARLGILHRSTVMENKALSRKAEGWHKEQRIAVQHRGEFLTALMEARDVINAAIALPRKM